jgi:hypothetical protein
MDRSGENPDRAAGFLSRIAHRNRIVDGGVACVNEALTIPVSPGAGFNPATVHKALAALRRSAACRAIVDAGEFKQNTTMIMKIRSQKDSLWVWKGQA